MVDASGSLDDGSSEEFVVAGDRPFFWVFAVAAVVLMYTSIGYARKYSRAAAFLLPPFICVCLAFDNIVMATTGIDCSLKVVRAMLAFHACIIPAVLLVCYELAYLVHKQKSVNFCGIAFDDSHRRVLGRNFLSTCLRFAVWMIAAALLAMNLIASYHWLNQCTEIHSVYDLQGDSLAHTVFSVLPAFVLVALSLYIGMQLWKYGTFYSYMIHATCFNPWLWMLVGSVALLTGYLLPISVYAVSSNAGELAITATIIRMFREVHRDMQQGQQMRHFIDPGSPNFLPPSPSQSNVLLDATKDSRGPFGSTYIQVATPRSSGTMAADMCDPGHPSAHDPQLVDVVVTSSRTNPLFAS